MVCEFFNNRESREEFSYTSLLHDNSSVLMLLIDLQSSNSLSGMKLESKVKRKTFLP